MTTDTGRGHLKDFDKGQIVMAKGLAQISVKLQILLSAPDLQWLVACQKWSKQGQLNLSPTGHPWEHNIITYIITSLAWDLDSKRPLKVCRGIWHWDINSRSFKFCKFRHGSSVDWICLSRTSYRCWVELRSSGCPSLDWLTDFW